MRDTVWTEVQPLVDDEPNATFWQPTFKVGDRVRLLACGECPMHGEMSVRLAGQTGVVQEIDPEEQHGHQYRVRVDAIELLPAAWMVSTGPWCAWNELEPLDGTS